MINSRMGKEILGKIAAAIEDLEDSEELRNLVKDALSKDIPSIEIVEKGIRKGLDKVGGKYEHGKYFLSELMYAGSLVEETFELVGPQLKEDEIENIGTIVLGTVRNDIHDIGKNIFSMLAKAEGFNVVDLGTDVESKSFPQNVERHDADIVGMSCLLTTTIQEMKTVVELLKEEGIRKKVKVIIGGNAVNDEISEEVGADQAALQAVNGVEICKQWVG